MGHAFAGRGILGALCGVSAALLAASAVSAEDAAGGNVTVVAALAAPSLAGRWSGTPHAVKNDASRCRDGECTLVLDIVPCGGSWCGIEIDRENACAGELMQLRTHSDPQRRNAFEGKLILARGTQEYVIDASVDAALDGRPATLEIVGDTGPEFRWFRRSFPFHAALARIGDAVCTAGERPLS
jgi:hypothetical protein